jgi:hypothetical protein
MRAKEFIIEGNGKITKRQRYATVGLHTFNDWGSYDLNRIMMMVAGSDGKTIPETDNESWAGKLYATSHPYTKEEHDMLKLAYKKLGIKFKDLNNGDLKSDELDSTNTQSTLKPFKGYKK